MMTRPLKKYTVKEWKKFDQWAERINGIDYTNQEIILQNYQVILTDWKSRKEKFIAATSFLSGENLDKGINKFQKIMKSVDKAFITWDKMKGKSLFGGSGDTSFLTGNNSNKSKRKLMI